MGLDTSSSLIPEWKRGHFSLVFDGSNCSTSGGGHTSNCDTSSSASGYTAANGASHTLSNGAASILQPAPGSNSSGSHQHGRSSSSVGGSSSSPRLLFLNRGKQHYIDVGADKKAMKGAEDADLAAELDAELDDLMEK